MEQIIRETTEKLSKGIITQDDANKILLDLFSDISNGRVYPELKLKWYQELIGAFKNRRY